MLMSGRVIMGSGGGMELDLECVASFVVLHEEGHFGRAANRLHLSQSALSKRMHRLEHQLGAPLLERSPAGTTSLTDAGFRLADCAGELLERARTAQAVVREAGLTGCRGPVRIGVPGLTTTEASVQILVRSLEALGRRVPLVSIRCVAVPYDHVLDSLLNHRVDVLWSPSVIEHPALRSYPLGAAPRAGIVPVLHPFTQTRSVTVEDFASMPILYNPAVPPGLMSPGWLGDIRPLREARLVPSAAQGLTALLNEVGRGDGLAVLPMILGMHLGTHTRAVVLDGAPPVEIHAVYRRADHGPRLKEVLDLLRALATEIPRGPDQPPFNTKRAWS